MSRWVRCSSVCVCVEIAIHPSHVIDVVVGCRLGDERTDDGVLLCCVAVTAGIYRGSLLACST